MIKRGMIKNERIVNALERWNECTKLGFELYKEGVKTVFTK